MYISNTGYLYSTNNLSTQEQVIHVLTGYLYTLQVICTVQVTCLEHIYEPKGYLYTLQVICTVQVTCLVHIYKPNRLFVHFTGYLYSTSNLFSTHL